MNAGKLIGLIVFFIALIAYASGLMSHQSFDLLRLAEHGGWIIWKVLAALVVLLVLLVRRVRGVRN